MTHSSTSHTLPESECTDQVVGDILSSWRYDISGLNPEMRRDYEHHLEECSHCSHRQQLHRTIDVVLISLSTVSTFVFLLALAIIHKFAPLQHFDVVRMYTHNLSFVLSLESAAVMGLLVSLLTWILVAVATPVPVYMKGVALEQARVLQDRIPEELRDRLPKIS
ncbi:MAG: hypothetical protein ACYCSN_16420 [Acidobacteriaceae bacterium]